VGDLDAANCKEYVRMLLRATEFHQFFFICHSPLVWEQADRVLLVEDGRVVAGDREAAAA
jgi:ABC-type transport system involved in cytochrome bd biosynthesis fused ATPase/permease subunit